MARLTGSPYACGECGKRRDDDVNHWFLVFIPYHDSGAGIVLLRSAVAAEIEPRLPVPEGVLVIRRWNEKAAIGADEHACGQECLGVMTSRYWATGKLGRLAA